ncbi:hypothetical protein G6F22_010304 [Rhizopus arrhizus]|nr:hypothetical protein G6F22_010304 [Rhizopus arrhizus]
MILDNVVWGFIGCGSVTEKKSGPALAGTPGSRVAAVMRRNAALAEDYARRHAIPRWYADADALVADPEVNAIYVATPPSTHMQYALQAIAAGKPVYIEKPMAMDHGECVRILEASARSGVPVSSNCWTAARSVRRAACARPCTGHTRRMPHRRTSGGPTPRSPAAACSSISARTPWTCSTICWDR